MWLARGDFCVVAIALCGSYWSHTTASTELVSDDWIEKDTFCGGWRKKCEGSR